MQIWPMRQTAAEEWLSYGRDPGETRFSPLDQIDFSNVQNLGVAWTYDTGSFRGLEATPLVHNGDYVCHCFLVCGFRG